MSKKPPKVSHGVIYYRVDPISGYQILLIKKSSTYAFCDFVNGRYRGLQQLSQMLNNMSYQEKRDITMLNFATLWYKTYNEFPEQLYYTRNRESYRNEMYYKCKSLFESSFLQDGGTKLKQLLSGTSNAEPLWEIPKGRAIKKEQPITAAMREFREETGIDPQSINTRVRPFVECYTDNGVTYKNNYYFAKCDDESNTNASATFDIKNNEVTGIQWFSIIKIRELFAECEIRKYSKIIAAIKKIR